MTTRATTVPLAQRWPAAARFLWALPLVAFAVAASRGFRPPIPWAATPGLFTCGLIPKRCGFGQVLAWTHFPAGHFAAFAVLATAILAVTALVYILICAASPLPRSAAGIILLMALGGSYSVTVLFAMNGFLDIPLALLAALSVAAPNAIRFWAALAAAAAGTVVHEGYLVMFIPVTLLPMLLDVRRWRDLAAPCLVALAGVAMAALLALGKPLPASALPHLVGVLQSRADFDIDYLAVQVMARSLGENLHMMVTLAGTSWWQARAVAGLAIVLPPAAMFVWAIGWGCVAPLRAKLLAIAAGLAPLAMNLIGFDTWRWSAVCIPTMLLAAVAMTGRYGPIRVGAMPLFVGVALMLAPLPLVLPRPLPQNPTISPEILRVMDASIR